MRYTDFRTNLYKVYVENKMGYELKLTGTFDDMMDFLDNHIIDKDKKDKVLVIERSKNGETPFYLYKGDYIEYLTFRADYFFLDDYYFTGVLKKEKKKKE